jgi:hypothetical protein
MSIIYKENNVIEIEEIDNLIAIDIYTIYGTYDDNNDEIDYYKEFQLCFNIKNNSKKINKILRRIYDN